MKAMDAAREKRAYVFHKTSAERRRDKVRRLGRDCMDAHMVADLLGCSERHVYDLARQRVLPFRREGSQLRFYRRDVEAYERSTYHEAIAAEA